MIYKIYRIFILFVLIILQSQLLAIDLDFSHKRGYYDNPILLSIEVNDSNAIIIYTTNNSKPTFFNGTVYTEPILLTGTTSVRAFAYSAFETGNVRTQSYIFLDDVINSDNMYSYVTQDPAYQSQMVASFNALPVISIVSSTITGPAIGLEVETSLEMFWPDNSKKGFMIHCGIETWGGSPTNPKKHYRLEFKEIYGEKSLKFNIFEPDNYDNTISNIEPERTFDKLLLRGGSQDGLNAEFGNENLAQFVRNRFLFDMQIEMGYPAPHGRFVHVFVNGAYNGQFHLMERPDADFFASYYGGEKEDYEVYKSGEIWDGPYSVDSSVWKDLDNHIDLSSQQNIDITNQYIDLDQAAAYLLLMSYASGFDWSKIQNCMAGGNINPGNGGYKFLLWDVDFATFNGGKWHPNYVSQVDFFDAPALDDGPIPDALIDDLEFRFIMADQMECNCFNQGLLTSAKADSLYMHRINQVSTSLIAESARWGGYDFDFVDGHIDANNWDVNDEFMTELSRVRNDYFPYRTDSMISNWQQYDFRSNLEGVVFNQNGGLNSSGFNLVLTNPNSNSDIYYTLDGSDPRSVGGQTSANAILYTGPLALTDGVFEVRARVKSNVELNNTIDLWSALCPRKFYIGLNYDGLVINEIHYNPTDSIYFNNDLARLDTVKGTNFEFLELKNVSNHTINLTDVYFRAGVRLTITDPIIMQPNDFLVIAEDEYWFEKKYGFLPDLTYNGAISNGGESIWLVNPLGGLIDSLTYQDENPWTAVPDDGVYSLALRDALSDNSNYINWAVQNVNYTPGKENSFCFFPIHLNNFTLDANCNGYSDAVIFTNISGGTPPYNYDWSNGSNSGFLFNIAAGTYFLTVEDSAGCSISDSIMVNEPPIIEVAATVIEESALGAKDGSISLSVSGGIAPYFYTWNAVGDTSSITNLASGNYNVEIIDANYCYYLETFEICPLGQSFDSDEDGICDGLDVCQGFDDNLDFDNDLIPNGCDKCEGFDDNLDTDLDGVPNACDFCEGYNDNFDEDNDGIPDGCDIDCNCSNAPLVTNTFSVLSSSDDAEEEISGSMNLISGDLDLIVDNFEKFVGIRFNNVNITTSSQLVNAYIQFTADEANVEATNLTIFTENDDDANIYNINNGNISSRNYFSDSVNWNNIPAWNILGESGVNQQTPNLTILVNNVIQQADWENGNAIAFKFQGTGVRTAESYNGSIAFSPKLILEFRPCLDSDDDDIADVCDICDNFDDNLIGTECNDLDDCTILDTWTIDCNCVGTYVNSAICEILDCPTNINLFANDEIAGTYKADDWIKSSSKINAASGGIVNYLVGDEYILLEINFTVTGEVEFNAGISDCNTAD